MKSTANEFWNGWKLAWYHNFTHIACAKKLSGLREKLDELRVQTGRTSCTNWTISFEVSGFRTKTRLLQKGFQSFKHILTQDFFCIQYAPFKATSSLSTIFWLHLLFFMHFMIYFELKWPWIEKHCKWTLKWLKVGMVS